MQQVIVDSIRESDKDLRDINHKIHSNPELGYKEFLAHDNIVALLKSKGIEVTPHAYGLETSFEATFGRGGRLVVFNVEYDALPEIGHACGHNLIATCSLAAFLGVVGVMKQNQHVAGRVRVLGTPAEEGGGGKIKLIDRGAYHGVDACLMAHPMSGAMFPPQLKNIAGIAYGSCVASAKFRATFSGKPAHAAAAPHEGINALDAAVLAYNGISMLRQQCRPSQRIHGIILEGGEKPNVIPSRSQMEYNVRRDTLKETKELQKRVMQCFEGAAVATGCRLNFEETNNYAELIPNRTLCAAYSDYMLELSSPQLPFDTSCDILESQPPKGSYSTDQGNVTQVCPGIHPIYSIPVDGGAANHTKEFTAAAGTEEAYQRTINAAKGMAATAWKVLTDDAFADEVRKEFERWRASN
ncbi:uncharacterized protein PV09_03147 [Verruconis gallopava]|uniref:Peptidase M20 domain-containing protein 2 n=1 Tax=Verruconis gallopava TaxID=253628 RepID=A0A0D1YZ49_9PEZI|nr:uncharacterized protein PV09_03147 [Verruconis gallopava]KIW05962.1 hypothetical protein PV09_03147 [Verruconis gallopava]